MRDPGVLDDPALIRVVDREGRLVGKMPDLDDDTVVEMYRQMLRTRVFDRKATAGQRQGRIGTFALAEGHEAIQIGSATAYLDRNVFVYPGYREHGVNLVGGIPMEVLLTYWRGLPSDEWDPRRWRQMIVTVPIATHLPHAVGHAYAARLRGEETVTVGYIGDGGTSEGDFHSALNFAGVWRAPTIFIISNNFYAISVPYERQTAAPTLAARGVGYGMPGVRVDGMDPFAVYAVTREAVDRAAAGAGPTLIEAVCYRFGPHATADDPNLYRTRDEEAAFRAYDPLVRTRRFLEARGLWDGAREEEAAASFAAEFDRALAAVEARPLPGRDEVIRHAYARIPAILVDELHRLQRDAGEEETPFGVEEVWVTPQDPEVEGPTEDWTMAEALNAALHEAMADDPHLVVLGEDVGVAGGVFRITEGLQERFGGDRVVDTPLDEAGIVGTAVGMAVAGSRVVAEIQFDGFVYPAFEQIVDHLGRMRYRTRGHLGLPIVVRWPNGAGIGAHEFHCDSPEAYFVHAPGLVVVVPSTPYDAKGLLAAAIRSEDPVIFLEPKVLYRAMREPVPTERYELPIGRARIRRSGSDLTLVTYGGMVPVAIRAAEAAAAEGVEVEVVDLRTLFPWDRETVLSSVERTGRLLAVQEPQRTAGFLAEVVAEVAERAGYALEAPPRRLAGTDAPWPQFALERHALLDDRMVLAEIRTAMAG